MTRLYLGTASVLNGETTVTVTAGDPLNAANCPPDASVIVGAMPGHVASRLSTTQFELAQPYAGADGSVALTIDPLTPEATSLVNLTVLAARVQAQLNVLDANSQGLFYTLLGVTGAADPGPGRIAFNHADPVSITAFYIDPIDANGRPVGGLIEQWEAGTVLIIRSLTTTAYVALSVTQAVELSGGYYPGLVAYLDHDGTIAPDEALSISWVPGGVGLEFDHAVDDLASRAAYDASAAGTRVLVADTGGGRAAIYVKRAGAGIWSAPAYIDGPQGAQGNMPTLTWLPAVTAAPGAPAAVDVSPVTGGYEVELTLPQGLPGSNGIDGTGLFSRVRAVSTANITIATALNNGDTIDGVALATNDLVLVAGQTAPAENGVYVVGASPARDSSFDTYDEHPGVYISVMEGTANSDTLWRCTSNKGGTIGSTAIVFTEFGALTNNAVTNAMLADVAAATFKGRVTAGTGDPEDLTMVQAMAALMAGGQIPFPATQIPSADANTLDDYEEGTTTPTITATSGTFATVTSTLQYVKIGRAVFFTFEIQMPAKGSATGQVFMTLPFTVGSPGFATGTERQSAGFAFGAFLIAGVTTASFTNYAGASIIADGRTFTGGGVYYV